MDLYKGVRGADARFEQCIFIKVCVELMLGLSYVSMHILTLRTKTYLS